MSSSLVHSARVYTLEEMRARAPRLLDRTWSCFAPCFLFVLLPLSVVATKKINVVQIQTASDLKVSACIILFLFLSLLTSVAVCVLPLPSSSHGQQLI